MRLVSHEPFTSAEEAVRNESDIFSDTINVETYRERHRVADTDIGVSLQESIYHLEQLLKAYQLGILIEKDE